MTRLNYIAKLFSKNRSKGQQDDLAVKVLAMQVWRLEFDPRTRVKEKKGTEPQGYSLTFIRTPSCT